MGYLTGEYRLRHLSAGPSLLDNRQELPISTPGCRSTTVRKPPKTSSVRPKEPGYAKVSRSKTRAEKHLERPRPDQEGVPSDLNQT